MTFTKSKLAVAVLAVTSSLAYANEQVVQLGVIDVIAENAGAKSKTNVVNNTDISRSTETDLRGLLREEPSINFGGGTATSQWLTVRGMGQDQVDFKVDNTYSDTQIFHHQGRFNLLDPSLIKRVSVVKGTGSASAGIGATSGQITATTVDAKDLLKDGQNFGFKANAGYNSNKGYSEGGSVYGRVENIDALLSGNWITNKEYKDGNGYRVNKSGIGQRALLGKIGIDLNENHRLVFSHRQERSHGERNLREEFDFALDSTSNRPNDPRYRITTQDTTNIQYIGQNIGAITRLDLNAYLMNVEREETATNSTTRVITRGVNANFDSAIGDNHMLKYGINFRDQKGLPSSFGAISITKLPIYNQEKRDLGAYLEGIWGFGAVTFTTGARYDYFKFKSMTGKEVSDAKFSPSVGLIWEAFDGLSFNASHNYATRSPRIFEPAIASGVNGRVQSIRNIVDVRNDLEAERSRNTEIGFNYKLNDSLALHGSYFWQTVKGVNGFDVVEYTTKSGRKYESYRNINNNARLENRGYELGATYRYEGLTLRASVADSEPELYGDAVDNNTTAISIGRTWTASVAYKFAQPDLELGWRGRFVEGKVGTPSRGSSNSNTPEHRPGYGVSDIFATWKPVENINLNFAVDNVFNKYYKSHSQRTGTTSLPETGRSFRANINYTF